jgi:hypothetical protein
MNLCVQRPSEEKGKGIRGVGRGNRQGSMYCPHYKHYFPAAIVCSSLSQFLCQLSCLRFTWYTRLFSFCPQGSDVGEAHGCVPATVRGDWLLARCACCIYCGRSMISEFQHIVQHYDAQKIT